MSADTVYKLERNPTTAKVSTLLKVVGLYEARGLRFQNGGVAPNISNKGFEIVKDEEFSR